MYHNKRFQLDKQFALIAFNHEQIKSISSTAYVMTNRANFDDIIRRIMNADLYTLNQLADRLKAGEHIVPQRIEEILCYNLIQDVDVVAQHITGSITSKQYMRNKIWSLIYSCGAPTWFVTFAPPDSKNPICLYYADKQVKFKPLS